MRMTFVAAFALAALTLGCGPAPGASGVEAAPIPMPVQARASLSQLSDEGPSWNLSQVAFQLALGGAPMVVAVLDTGADATHPLLAGRVYPVLDVVGTDIYDNKVDFTGRDGNGHGTHVAGIVTAMGAEADVRVLPVKVIPHTGVGDDRLLTTGIEQALAWRDGNDPHLRVQVINLSVSSPEVSERLVRVIRRAVESGVLVVGASGNDGKAVEFPATMPEVLTVGATTVDGDAAEYSCFGDALDVAAPGGSDAMPVYSTWPTYLTASDLDAGKQKPHLTAGLVGTSMAAPHVSGAAALLWTQHPELTMLQVRARLLAMAEDHGIPGPDPKFGYGTLNVARAISVDGHDAR